MRKEVIGDATLILGDCRDVLPTLGRFDALVTDPPYGIGKRWGGTMAGKNGSSRLWSKDAASWDAEPIDAGTISAVLAAAPTQIVWGGNYYALGAARGWLVWDKIQKFSGADAELAYTNLDIPVRVFRMSRIEAYGSNAPLKKEHPTEKPLALMRWCIGHLPDNARTILDPFMGAGTTGLAALDSGRQFTGIEREQSYFDIACRRIEEAYRQPRLVA
ncbi:MAG: site-specific DNA-methyltransferase [Alphaproteobacteria bacterium]